MNDEFTVECLLVALTVGQAGCKIKNSLLKLKIRNSLHLVRRDPLVDYLQKSQ